MSQKRVSDARVEEVVTLGDLLYGDSTAPISEQDWAQLVQSMAAGDQQALRTLYERSHRMVFTLVMRIAGHREMAEELTVDVFHDVWRRSAEYDPVGGSVLGWIMMQARSRAIDRVRFEQRKKRAPDGDAHHGGDGDGGGDTGAAGGPADAIHARQRNTRLHQALAALTADERQAIETAYFAELSYAETANRLAQPLGTVKTRVRSALAKLRDALGDEGEPT